MEYLSENDDYVERIKLLGYFYGLEQNDISELDDYTINILYTTLNLYISTVLDNMTDEKEEIQKKKSLFDEYDEENGYTDEIDNKNSYEIARNNIYYIIKYCVTSRLMTAKECYDFELIDLFRLVNFNIKYDKEHENKAQ